MMRLQFLPYNPAKSSYDPDTTVAESPQQHAARVYHGKTKLLRKAVRRDQQSMKGSRERPAPKAKVGTTNKAGSSHAHDGGETLLLDPVTILGAGRVDPFDAYCTSDHTSMVHEMLDHAISNQWTLFAADDTPGSLLVAKQAVMDTAIRFPVCFHTLVYSGATHKAFHQSPAVDNSSSAVLRLKSKGDALKALQVASQSVETTQSDGVIFAMALLTILGHGEKVTSETRLERRTLAAQQDGQFYASMEYEWRHWRALIEVVKMKGGLHTIQFPGLGFAIASFDIHSAIMAQTKPAFPLFMPSSLVVSTWPTSQPGSPALENASTLATAFALLEDLELPAALELLKVLHGMRDLTIAFDSYQRRDHEVPPIKMIIFARNLNQHELLTLPDLSEEFFADAISAFNTPSISQEREALAVYELCRLGAFVFQMTVLLPNLHSDTNVTIPYAQRIRTCLQHATSTLNMHENPIYNDLLLWVGLMSAWLIKDTRLYTWFLNYLVEHLNAGRVSKQAASDDFLWLRVKDIMASFLWLDSECAMPCAEIWDEVEALRHSKTSNS